MDSPDKQTPLDVLELLALCRMVLEKTIEQGTREVSLEHDFYWSIAPEQRYYVYDEPEDLSIGQLSSDLDSLRSLVDYDSFVPPNALVWLARLMEALGDEIMP
ncbi:MAG TPA: hypothetical protein VL068_00670 [Microthrixaceae bacterium]|nr:hypothetical protein [Microthrixaceae bacterium]